MAMMSHAGLPPLHLEVTALELMRGPRLLLSDFSFVAAPGDVVLLRGPNGAGKSSLLLCLAGLLRPEAGKINWQGIDAETRPETCLHLIGHKPAVKPGLSLEENLRFWADMLGGDKSLVAPALDRLGLGHAAELDASLLSAGQTRRLALARLLVAPRPVWLLDEPTSALDKNGEALVAQLIEDHITFGGLVIAATHLDLPLAKSTKMKTVQIGGKP